LTLVSGVYKRIRGYDGLGGDAPQPLLSLIGAFLGWRAYLW
jgi:hypothetical protein